MYLQFGRIVEDDIHRNMMGVKRPKIVMLIVFIVLQMLLVYHSFLKPFTWSSESIFYRNGLTSKYITKPHLVMGILTADGKRDLRDAQRNTWLYHASHADIPFIFTYKFLIDEPTNATETENIMYNDILYLNTTTHGRAKKFGEKNYKWFKYIHEHYPDALLGARVDDDTFVCVPQMFERLAAVQSHTLYYGWGHPPLKSSAKIRRIDEMFVVLGDENMKRISNRKYCDTRKDCNFDIDLVEKEWGGESIFSWLKIYTDIDNIADNKNIIQIGRGQANKDGFYVNKQFCDKYLLYHKSSPKATKTLHEFQMNSMSSVSTENNLKGSVTGTLFSGKVTRELPTDSNILETFSVKKGDMISCYYWAVVTTIFNPSEAVIRIAKNPKWCLVIVADVRTPDKDVYIKSIAGQRIQFLSVQAQLEQYPELSRSIPLNHFGRKNIGYMYAIHHGAKYIWDFDDDNIGIIDLNHFSNNTGYVTACREFGEYTLNPYPYFGVKHIYTWPRGFPLQHIKNNKTVPRICKLEKMIKVGVIQSLANIQPDVDAIYRLTHDMPFNFTGKQDTAPFVVQKGVYTPFNAQATMWIQPAFALLPLPVSVNGRVSDIWRSYIAQFFMHKNDISLIFSIPYIDQIRNEHMDIKDFNAENDLYEKSDQLIKFLSSNEASTCDTLKKLYEELYRRQYLEIEDIIFINAWTNTFEAIKGAK